MYKIAILGCENSHADAFIKLIQDGTYKNVEIVGVYSDDPEAVMRMQENYGVYTAKSYDEFVGRIDGLVITARHGDNHLKYALPYVDSNIPMFIDKPITASVEDALELGKILKTKGIRYCGGSSCALCPEVVELRKLAESATEGKVIGGYLRAPMSRVNEYGNFWFYSQHLVQIMQTVFGCYPTAVTARDLGGVIDVLFEYPYFTVMGSFTDGNYLYNATLSTEKSVVSKEISVTEKIFAYEFDEFYKLLKGGESETGVVEFISPVYVIDAILCSLESGERKLVVYPEEAELNG